MAVLTNSTRLALSGKIVTDHRDVGRDKFVAIRMANAVAHWWNCQRGVVIVEFSAV